MGKHSLRLLFLRKYRTSKKYYRQLKSHATRQFSDLESGERNNSSQEPPNTSSACIQEKRLQRKTPPQSSVDSVDCCLLIYDCVSENKLKTFVFVLFVGILSTSGLYIHNQRILQYRKLHSEGKGNVDIVHDEFPSHDDDFLSHEFPFHDEFGLRDEFLLHDEFRLRDKFRSHKEIPPSISNNSNLYRIYRQDVFSPTHGISLRRCAIPKLEPFSSEVKPFIFYNARPNCAHEQRSFSDGAQPFIISNGSLIIRNVDAAEVAGCCYRPFHRSGDNDYWSAHSCTALTEKVTKISDDYDYVEVLCIHSTSPDFRDGFALAHRKIHAEDRIAQFKESSTLKNRLSVLILGLDATSRMNFIRAMPKANKYLLRNLSAISLNGYTKVAENTLPNVVPLLTGRTLEEFKDECVDNSKDSHSVHLDGCPFIWKAFAENGFRTSFGEDDVDIGIFNMNWPNAFTRPPTDYYLRPYSLLMQRRISFSHGYCYGPVLSFQKILESVRSIAEAVDNYFQFTWSTKLSHDDLNKMRWGDKPLRDFLHYMHSNGYLNNTALLILGDHGSRLDRIRSTGQGKLEDRMPIAYFVLPEWFKTKYSRAYENLKRNSNRVTSAFDIHKTLFDFIDLDNIMLQPKKSSKEDDEEMESFKLPNNETVSLNKLRGSSLFEELPENRTCFSAGIPLHWCICHRKILLNTEVQTGNEAAEFVVGYLNNLLKDQEGCVTLKLKSVDEVSQWDSSDIIQEGCESLNDNITASSADLNATTDMSNCINSSDVFVLQVAFTVNPSEATFETTLIKMSNGRWRITEAVVRTNSYEGQSSCVEQKYKPYCYCGEDESFFDGFF